MDKQESSVAQNRIRLAAVLNAGGDIIRITDAQNALGIERNQAAKLLSRWAKQGWLQRVDTGAYVPVQLEFLNSDAVVEDPWILVPSLFAPAYIGGRTAAEHWDLTEQIFRDIVVFSAKPIRKKTIKQQNAIFTIKQINEDKIFGTTTIWRGQTKILISDIHRTIIDMLNDPETGGGIQHIADCFQKYLGMSEYDPNKLISYADRLGNGALFKRLGYIAELYVNDKTLTDAASKRLTKGNTKLDKTLDCSRLITRWRLRVPETWVSMRKNDR
jgi:predicted transcriptional regulator of viral defense system